MDERNFLDEIGPEIRELVSGYIRAESFTHSPGEKDAERFFLDYFRGQPYWKNHPELLGSKPIPEDPFDRAAAFAMVRGSGHDTIVMIHHNDVVTVEDFKRLRPFAFSPELLEEELKRIKDSFSPEIQADLEAGTYLYGRGVCDMKGGGAIQMALLRRYGALVEEDAEALSGNLIVLAVPDEENLSAGMRTAVLLLAELRDRYGLKYQLMINSEPHQRKDPEVGVLSTGSVGKLMPFVYVRGYLAHVGKVFEGFNPVNLLSAIVRKTEVNMQLSDVLGKEAAPPPTWLFCRDQKLGYDVSIPLSAAGCLSVLTLNQTPATLLEKIRHLCQEAFQQVLEDMNRNYSQYLQATGQPQRTLPWQVKVTDFAQLCQEARAVHGSKFETGYQAKMAQLEESIRTNQRSLLECNFELVEYVYGYVDDLSPRVIYGLVPPYYPNVSNQLFCDLSPAIQNLSDLLSDFAWNRFGQRYDTENFYTGISDLSYSSLSGSEEVLRALQDSMPLWGKIYYVPAEEIESISMPCINIGPWGKDFHKLTERVLKQDLYERTPQILLHAVRLVLEGSR